MENSHIFSSTVPALFGDKAAQHDKQAQTEALATYATRHLDQIL